MDCDPLSAFMSKLKKRISQHRSQIVKFTAHLVPQGFIRARPKPINTRCSRSILIGSRVARPFLSYFRGISEDNTIDWDIITSTKFVLKWLCKKAKIVI